MALRFRLLVCKKLHLARQTSCRSPPESFTTPPPTPTSSTRKSNINIEMVLLCLITCLSIKLAECIIFFPRGGSQGYLAAVAMPLDLSNRNVYMSFNFEANYGFPSNDSYNEWRDRWNLDENFVGIGNNVTAVNGRKVQRSLRYTRSAFYRGVAGYLEHFQMNGTGCLLRTICEVAASSLDENNGLLGSIFKILFMPTTSAAENEAEQLSNNTYEAEHRGRHGQCSQYERWCPQGVLGLISQWL